MSLLLSQITFSYDALLKPLFTGVTVDFPQGWTGIVGPNGAGKTTLLRLACGELLPQTGSVRAPGPVLYCAQRTDEPPAGFGEFLGAEESEACALRGRLRIDPAWLTRWETLSHGERKRAQIAVALWKAPAGLALDEPANHIDADARALLAAALKGFHGVGLLVSHDRELLDLLCGQCLFVAPPGAVLRKGNYTRASAQAARETATAQERREQARRKLNRLKTAAVTRRQAAEQSSKRLSKRGLRPGDHDARRKIDQARVSGKDTHAGQLFRQLNGRIRQAEAELQAARVPKETRLGIWVEGERSRRDVLFRLPAGEIPLGTDRRLEVPELWMRPDDRVAVKGPNGSGKSTLIRAILERLDLPAERVTYVPQEIDLSASASIMRSLGTLSEEKRGHVLAVVSRLGSRPERVVQTEEPSPGEVRKILLGLGIACRPHLIIMDEPTNHLDLPAIECLEDALAGCPCGLLLVSHDFRFLGRLTRAEWRISADPADPCRMVLKAGAERPGGE
jgi:macrolide transport system ATP-binding/permease protein